MPDEFVRRELVMHIILDIFQEVMWVGHFGLPNSTRPHVKDVDMKPPLL